MRTVQHMSISKGVTQFFQKGLPASGMARRVDYIGVQDAEREQPGFRNVATTFLTLPLDALAH